jgi:molybdopterin synthase catalytic subunit
MSISVHLAEQQFNPGEELDALLDQAEKDGAVASFVGIARPTTKGGEQVDRLVLEPHPTLTRQSLEEIAKAAAERFRVSHVRVIHRCGDVRPGEPIIFAGAAAAHRRAAFEATDYLMDHLKTQAVLWKREEGPAGVNWIEPTETDYRECDRWG